MSMSSLLLAVRRWFQQTFGGPQAQPVRVVARRRR
jgi:hypothetical protein